MSDNYMKIDSMRNERKLQMKGTENLIGMGGFIRETIENQIFSLYSAEVGAIAEKCCPIGPGFWEVIEAVDRMSRKIIKFNKMNTYLKDKAYINYLMYLDKKKTGEPLQNDQTYRDEEDTEKYETLCETPGFDDNEEISYEDMEEYEDMFEDDVNEEDYEFFYNEQPDEYEETDDYYDDDWSKKAGELTKDISEAGFRQWLLEQAARCELEMINQQDDFWKNLDIPRNKKGIIMEMDRLEQKVIGLLYGLNGQKKMEIEEIAGLPEFNCHPFYILSVKDYAERLLNSYELNEMQLRKAYEHDTDNI